MKSCRNILTLVVLLSVLAVGGTYAQAPWPYSSPPANTADWPAPDRSLSPAGSGWQIEMVDAPKTFRFLSNRSLAWDGNGHPHIAYGIDRLYYARHDGVSWQLSTVDEGPGVGLWASLALDASAVPRIAYLDQVGEQLKYASFDGSAWHMEVVAPAGWCGWEGGAVALALDAAGRPRIVYCGPGGLRYAWHDGSSWHTEVVAPSGDFPALALDAAGRPHISYEGSGGLVYASYDGTAWQFETLGTWASYTSLALDVAGHPHISAGDASSVTYLYHDGSAWHSQTIAAAYIRGATSLALDGNGLPRVSYVDGDTDQLMFAAYDGTAWQVQVVAGTTSWNATRNTSLALDGTGRPHIAYLNAYDLDYASYDGTTWQVETVDRGGAVGTCSSLALDAVGLPHISYYDRVNGDLKYAHYDGTAWQITTVDGTRGAGCHTSIAVDSTDRPHLAYCRLDPDSPGVCMDLVYAYHDGTSWITTTVNAGYVGEDLSLALDTTDHPHISYYNSSNEEVRYAAYDGTSWHVEMVADVRGSPEGTSLALDSAGLPHISYYNAYSAMPAGLAYARYDGAAWQIEIAVSGYDVGWASSLALDSSDRPHISYFSYNDWATQYAYYDGSSWQNETVSYSPYYIGATSLALDANDRPHVSFLGWAPTYGLAYAFRSASGWVKEIVDPDSTTRYLSLALDAAGDPHISYYDDLNFDLRYAYRACYPVQAVHVTGPTSLPVGVTGSYEASYEPLTATVSLITWDNGMSGTNATYSWATVGTHTIVATTTAACGEAQGSLDVAVFCQAVTGLDVSGPPVLAVNQTGTYQAAVQPVTASRPLTLTWDNGTVGDSASYSWPVTGTYTVAVTATNVCGPGPAASWQVRVIAAWPEHVYLPLLVRETP